MEYDQIQKIYHKICCGYDEIKLSNEVYYFKHTNYADRIVLKKRYDEGLQVAKNNGVKTEVEYLDFYIEKKWWSKNKEDQIRTSRAFIANLIKSKNKLLLPSQKEEVQRTIEEESKKLNLILIERKSIIPTTAEEYAEKYYHRYYLNNLIYKDKLFNIPISDSEDYFDNLEDDLYDNLWSQISDSLNLLKNDNLKYVAATGFFQNLIILTGADFPIYNFYGKPIINLTTYQIDIFSYASMYRKIINNTTEKISEDILNEPEKLITWCESGGQNTSKTKKILDKTPNEKNKRGERSGRITSLVGAKSSDYKEIGMNAETSNIDLVSAASEQGGELNIYGAIKKTDAAFSKK